MDAAVLYSGGKDSSFTAVMLERMGLNTELYTVNFGIYDSYIPAEKSAKALNFKHHVLHMDKEILEKTCEKIIEDGFPNNGIKYIHQKAVEELAQNHNIIADGTRRDDRTPKLNINQIKSLEDRLDVQYINLDSFGHKTIRLISQNLFEIIKEKSDKDKSSDFEIEIRIMIDQMGYDSSKIFPEHYQTRVIGYKIK